MAAQTDGSSQEPLRRQLRSKESPKVDSSLFNFEQNPDLVDSNQKLVVVEGKVEGQVMEGEPIPSSIAIRPVIKKLGDSDDEAHGNNGRRALRKSTSRKANLNVKDPLDDELYLTYHRRMEKEEKKMTNRDREKIYSEADKMRSQLEALQSHEWHKSLPNITFIRDPRKIGELNEKRQWTMDSLNSLLSRFDGWKKREERLMGRNRSHVASHNAILNDLSLYTNLNKYEYIGNSDTDDEEDGLSTEEIRRKRMKKRTEQFGPVIKIKFGHNVVIAEPFKATRIEKL